MLRSLRSKEGFAWEETVGLSNWLCAQHRGDATYLGMFFALPFLPAHAGRGDRRGPFPEHRGELPYRFPSRRAYNTPSPH